jgi:hypothetical protein
MPVLMPDPDAGKILTKEPVYVWENASEPGLYGLCTNRDFKDYQTANWKFRGELSLVQPLRILNRNAVMESTVGGWPMSLRVDQAFYLLTTTAPRDYGHLTNMGPGFGVWGENAEPQTPSAQVSVADVLAMLEG